MIENLQVHLANVQAPNPTKGTSGAEVDAYANVVSNMACRVIDASASWKILYAQRHQDITHQVFTNQSPTVSTGFQLLWNGRTLRVIGVVNLGGNPLNAVMRLDCQEIV